MANFVVFIQSEEFGRETFAPWDNLPEALAQVERLVNAALDQYREDHIEREIGILVNHH